MSLFADLWQDWRLGDAEERSDDLEQRVVRLEQQLKDTKAVVRELIARLEGHLNHDLNDNGRVG